MSKTKEKKREHLDKIIDFGRQLFAAILRSRTGALTELAKLLRFQKGTKGFERQFNKLLPLITELKEAYRKCVLAQFPEQGLRLGIFDDSPIKKTGKCFPEQKTQHDHSSNSFFEGMRVMSSCGYQKGKTAVVNSRIVGKEENKLELAKEEIDMFLSDFFVDILLYDSWYCKEPVIKHLLDKKALFVSRTRTDTITLFEESEVRLDVLAMSIPHSVYKHVKINGKSYWVLDQEFEFKAFGELRVIFSKEKYYDKPIFLITNALNFSAKFIVSLYLKRFSIEVFFKDAKQFLNFETFLCRNPQKWNLHLHLTNVLHWAIQKIHSISKTVRIIRENIGKCLLFINQNPLIDQFFDELKKRCQT